MINTNTKNLQGILDTIRVKKRHNAELRHIIEMLSTVIHKGLFCCCINAHCCHELLDSKVYVS